MRRFYINLFRTTVFLGDFTGPAFISFQGGKVIETIKRMYGVAFGHTFVGVMRLERERG